MPFWLNALITRFLSDVWRQPVVEDNIRSQAGIPTTTYSDMAIMELLKSVIVIMAFASLGISAAAAYLRINKLWKRKHHPEVADSISITANVILIIPLSVYSLNYLFANLWVGLLDSLVWIGAAVVSILIGSRLWVEGHRHKSFWTRAKESLKLERSEVGDLAKSFFRPSNAEMILEIFTRFAYIDRTLVAREREFIESFAHNWHLKFDWGDHSVLADLDKSMSLVRTRDAVAAYLSTSPPAEQVAQLGDVLHALVKIDEDVSDEERLILDEVTGLLQNYINESASPASYAVVIAPQNHEQDSAIATLLPGVEKSEVAGGSGYMVGSFYSRDYADMICKQYRSLGFFTIELRQEAQ